MSIVLEDQRRILTAVFLATSGPAWSYKAGWNTDASLENWVGVRVENDYVVELDLGRIGLKGSIPPELGSLQNLTVLSLLRNQLSGSIPPELGSLEKLERLNLSDNALTGCIPRELGRLEKLKVLILSYSNVTGCIPRELGSLEKLEHLSLAGSKLTGSIPPELGSLKKLKVLKLSHNKLTGSIPPELGRLEKLEELRLSHNKLTGSIPPELGGLVQLDLLYLQYNHLSGSIPRELGSMEELAIVDLSNNKLTGFATGTSEDWILRFCPNKWGHIRVEDNPLQYPPVGVLEQGQHMTQKYFQDLSEGRREVTSLKVMLLGPTTVGKTSLMLSIIAGRPTATVKGENPSTVGVDINSYDLKGHVGIFRAIYNLLFGYSAPRVSCRFFDCGGQQDYHGLSSMFMTEGAAYLLVWSPPDDLEGAELKPFLEILRHGASKSTVLLVANQCDRWEEAQGDLKARCEVIHGAVKEKLREGRIALGEEVHMTSCKETGGGEKELKMMVETLMGLGQTYVMGPLLEKAVTLLGDMAEKRTFLTMGEVEEAWKVKLQEDGVEDEDKELADVMLQCGVKMLDRNGRLVVAGDVEKGAAVVLTEAALFSQLISPLLTPAGDIITDGGEVLLGRNKGLLTPALKPKRQVDDGDSGLELDRKAANKLKKDGVLTSGFAGSVWNAVLVRHGGGGGRTFDEGHVEALLGRLVDLGIIFEKAEHDNTPGGGVGGGGGTPAKEQELQFVVSLRMPDAMDSSNKRAQALKNAADAISLSMKEGGYLKQVHLQLERPPSPGTIARLVSTLSTKGLGEVAVGWRQGALFVDAKEAYMVFVSYDWENQRLYLKVAGQWEEGEKQCDSFPTVAMGMLLRHTVHHLSSHNCRWKAVYVVKDIKNPLKEVWGPLCEGDLQGFGCALDDDGGTNERGLLSEYDVERLIATPVLSPRWAPPTLALNPFPKVWTRVLEDFKEETDEEELKGLFKPLRTCVKGFEKYQERLREARAGLDTGDESLAMRDDKGYQVFLSHAGPEKRGIVYLLYRCLWQRGIPTFLDEESLQAGDRADHKMLHVARTAPIGVVVLSPSFVCREWPLQEMNIFMDRAAKGEAALVPLFFGLTVQECWDTGKLEDNHPGVKKTWGEWSQGDGGDWGWLEQGKTADELAKDLLGRVGEHTGLRDDQQEDLLALAKRVANKVERALMK